MRLRRLALLGLAAGPLGAQAWRPVDAGTGVELRGLATPAAGIVWISGAEGTVRLTEDGGVHWRACPVPGGGALEFRDVEALDAHHAWILASGPGDLSRIYRTTDGGRTWALQFRNPAGEGFLDALAFWDGRCGLAMGDPVRGRFQVLRTEDGGAHWTPVPEAGLPPALPGEGAFAASGTCLRTGAPGEAWFATGGAEISRIFRTRDGGLTWTVAPAPVPAGSPSKGLFTLAFFDGRRGLALGGDHQEPALGTLNGALTEDGGLTWHPAPVRPGGYRSGSSLVPGRPGAVVAVGPGGSGYSLDHGRSWTTFDGAPLNAVTLVDARHGWAVGPRGRVMRLEGALPEPAPKAPDRP